MSIVQIPGGTLHHTRDASGARRHLVHHVPDGSGARRLIDGSGASITTSVKASTLAGPESIHADMEVVNCFTLRYIGLAVLLDI